MVCKSHVHSAIDLQSLLTETYTASLIALLLRSFEMHVYENHAQEHREFIRFPGFRSMLLLFHVFAVHKFKFKCDKMYERRLHFVFRDDLQLFISLCLLFCDSDHNLTFCGLENEDNCGLIVASPGGAVYFYFILLASLTY